MENVNVQRQLLEFKYNRSVAIIGALERKVAKLVEINNDFEKNQKEIACPQTIAKRNKIAESIKCMKAEVAKLETKHEIMKIEMAQVNQIIICENLPERKKYYKWNNQDLINPSKFRAPTNNWIPNYQRKPMNKWINPKLIKNQQQDPDNEVNIQSKHRVWTPNQQKDPNSKVNTESKHRVWTPSQQQDPENKVVPQSKHRVWTPNQDTSSKVNTESKHRVWTPNQQQDPEKKVVTQSKHKVWTPNQQQNPNSKVDRYQKMDIQSKHRVWTPKQQQEPENKVDSNKKLDIQSAHKVWIPKKQQEPENKVDNNKKRKEWIAKQQQKAQSNVITSTNNKQQMNTQAKRRLPTNETQDQEQPNKRQKLMKQDYTSDGQSATELSTSSCSLFDDDNENLTSSMVEYESPFQ